MVPPVLPDVLDLRVQAEVDVRPDPGPAGHLRLVGVPAEVAVGAVLEELAQDERVVGDGPRALGWLGAGRIKELKCVGF